MGRSSAPRRENIQLRKVFDNVWTLAAILAAYWVVNIPLQRRVWAALAATKLPTNERHRADAGSALSPYLWIV
jgi:hypothetical protein